jgi:hypothetical protein
MGDLEWELANAYEVLERTRHAAQAKQPAISSENTSGAGKI